MAKGTKHLAAGLFVNPNETDQATTSELSTRHSAAVISFSMVSSGLSGPSASVYGVTVLVCGSQSTGPYWAGAGRLARV